MNLLEEISAETAKEGEPEGYQFDPLTILLVASAIASIIRLYMECKKSHEDATKSCNEMSKESEKLVYKTVRDKMGLLKYTFGGGARIAHKIISRARRIRKHEMETLYKEVGEN